LRPPVAFVLKGYPRLSETFIAQEILGLERRGFDIRIVSLRRPTDGKRHPVHAEIRAPVAYLPEYLYREPLRVLRAWWAVRRRPGYRAVRDLWLRDWRRDPTPNRGRRFGQALVLAHELQADIVALHAHFLHTPASVARYAARLAGLPFGISAHAKDIWTIPDWEAREKLADCRFAVACSRVAAERLAGLAPDGNGRGTVSLVYHGLDLGRFPPLPRAEAALDGSDPTRPVRLVSVGRAVAKKGYEDLLEALARLPKGLSWHFTHIGGGALTKRLRKRARALGLEGRIAWRGAQAQAAVLAALREADLFVLASRVTGDGDRDGLPNVLMEAGSQGLAVLATRVSAIPELIEDGVSGVLADEGDVAGLAAALARLIGDPAARRRHGVALQRRIAAEFDHEVWLDRLAGRFDAAAAERRAAAE